MNDHGKGPDGQWPVGGYAAGLPVCFLTLETPLLQIRPPRTLEKMLPRSLFSRGAAVRLAWLAKNLLAVHTLS